MAVTKNDIIQQYLDSIRAQGEYNKAYAATPWSSMYGSDPGHMQTAAMTEANKQNQLKSLLSMGVFDDNSSNGGNPFGTGAGGGAPTLNTSNAFAAPVLDNSNRFESGLSDAEARLRALLDNPDSIRQSAAYKFRVGQGTEAINRSLGAKGLLNSGNRLMELTKYGQDMGSQEYDAQAGRLGDLFGRYQQGWLGDKNANTGRFAAQSTAWLGDKNASTNQFQAQANAWNTAQGNADRNRLGLAQLAWDKQKPQGGGGISRASSAPSGGGIYQYGPPVDWNAFTAQQNAQRDYLDRY